MAGADIELRNNLIDSYANLQRIKSSPDRDKELDYQIKTTKVKLESMGVVTEDLLMD